MVYIQDMQQTNITVPEYCRMPSRSFVQMTCCTNSTFHNTAACHDQDPDPSCNAWTFCLGSPGCIDGNATHQPQSVRTCSLYFDPGLLYNYPMDSENGTLRGPEVNFTSGLPSFRNSRRGSSLSHVLRQDLDTARLCNMLVGGNASRC